MSTPDRPAIELVNVAKSFKRTAKKREHSTMKTELVRWLTGRKSPVGAETSNEHILALRDISLSIPRGRTVGIIGHNGSGKSTLLKLITGIYRPTDGKIAVNGRVSALLELGAGFHPDFTGRENVLINGIILGMTRAELKNRLDEILAFAELGDFIDEPVRTYSSGMFMRLAFAVATHVDPDILVIDEILAVGDEAFQKKSLARMQSFKQSGRTIVLVSHVLETVENWCDTAVWLEQGTVKMVGAPKDVVRRYREHVSGAPAPAPTAFAATEPAPVSLAAAPLAPPRTGSIQLMQNGSQVSAPIHSGSGLEIGLDEVDGARVHIEIKSADGAVAIASFVRERSTDTATLVLPSVPFASGTYKVIAALHRDGEDVQLREVPLLVEAPSIGPGVVHLSHEWR